MILNILVYIVIATVNNLFFVIYRKNKKFLLKYFNMDKIYLKELEGTSIIYRSTPEKHERIPSPPPVEHDYVEIGGVKWATMNVGANAITDGGLYFQWGDAQGYTAELVPSEKAFSWDDYKWTEDGGSTFTKYNATDGKTVLDPEDDAVTAAWGDNWRMPTTEEYQALYEVTTSQWTTIDGVNGRLFTSKDDSSKTLFFPAAGSCEVGNTYNVGNYGDYWSSSLGTNDIGNAWYLVFNDSNAYNYSLYRSRGYSVRGVFAPKP